MPRPLVSCAVLRSSSSSWVGAGAEAEVAEILAGRRIGCAAIDREADNYHPCYYQ